MRRAALALLCLAAAPAPPTPGWHMPVPGACISSPFGLRHKVGPHAALRHNGIDLPAAAGTWVTAAAPGQVLDVRRLGSSGLEVDIAVAPHLVTRYAHLGSVAPTIASGRSRLAAGDRIGRVGRSGITYGTHLHFEIRQDGTPIDPAPWLPTRPCGSAG